MGTDLEVRDLASLSDAVLSSLSQLKISEWQEIKGGSFLESLEAWREGPTEYIVGLCFLIEDQAVGMTLFKRPPLAYDVLKRRPKTEIFVMTNALCKGDPKEMEAWTRVVELAMARKTQLIPIVLTVDFEELSKRVSSAERLDSKLKDPSALRKMIQEHELQVPSVTEFNTIRVQRHSTYCRGLGCREPTDLHSLGVGTIRLISIAG